MSENNLYLSEEYERMIRSFDTNHQEIILEELQTETKEGKFSDPELQATIEF